MSKKLACKLCDAGKVYPVFSDTSHGKVFTSYYCVRCDVYQTLGDIAPVSPDYVDLTSEDLTEEHVYLQRAHKHPAFKEWLENVRKLNAKFDQGEQLNVLDIGCGVGGFLDFAAERGLRTYGFDASATQIAAAQGKHPNVRHAVSLEDYVGQIDESVKFDLVTMWDVFEHIRDPFPLIKDVKKHLAPGGVFFVSVPGGKPIPSRIKVQKLLKKQSANLIPWEHVFYHTRKSLRIVFAKGGFDVLKIDGVAPYVRAMSVHEAVRRVAHRILKKTPYAFQLTAYVRPRNGVG